MQTPNNRRRSGYSATNPAVGRRGSHTRERILEEAGQLFLLRGFHRTSIDAIAQAVGGSRATVYQYFADKDQIFVELAHRCEPVVLEHARTLGRLGPDAAGIANLRDWLDRWSGLYDQFAMVFLEFPGTGTIEGAPETGVGVSSRRYAELVEQHLRTARVAGIDAGDATAALLRIAHMLHVYRYRNMFGLTPATALSPSLTLAMQLLLFPNTPPDVLASTASIGQTGLQEIEWPERRGLPVPPAPTDMPPIRHDVRIASSELFADRGYHAVSMDEIASAASISRATLFRHFNSKETLLSELTERAVSEGSVLAAQLHQSVDDGLDPLKLRKWLADYVRFHRAYCGVIRTWYDGGLSIQLADFVSTGMQPFNSAAIALTTRYAAAPGLDRRIGALIFLAVLGRLSELRVSGLHPDSVEAAADLMLVVLQRALMLL